MGRGQEKKEGREEREGEGWGERERGIGEREGKESRKRGRRKLGGREREPMCTHQSFQAHDQTLFK